MVFMPAINAGEHSPVHVSSFILGFCRQTRRLVRTGLTARRHRRRHRAMSLRAALLLPFFRLPPNNRIEQPSRIKPLHPSATPRHSRPPLQTSASSSSLSSAASMRFRIADVTARRAISASSCRRLSASSASRRFFSSASMAARCCASYSRSLRCSASNFARSSAGPHAQRRCAHLPPCALRAAIRSRSSCSALAFAPLAGAARRRWLSAG